MLRNAMATPEAREEILISTTTTGVRPMFWMRIQAVQMSCVTAGKGEGGDVVRVLVSVHPFLCALAVLVHCR